jgi:phage terminase large subunit GpA-like protein
MAEAVRREAAHHREDQARVHPLEWQKFRERNEALDCRVCARAAAWMAGADRRSEVRWADLEAHWVLVMKTARRRALLPARSDRSLARGNGGWFRPATCDDPTSFQSGTMSPTRGLSIQIQRRMRRLYAR